MKPVLIEQQLIDAISKFEHFEDMSNNSSPGHYGHEDWDIEVDTSQFFVNINKRKVTFSNLTFSGKVLFGNSGEDAPVLPFSKKCSGVISFDFDASGKNVFITDVSFDDDKLYLLN